MKYKPHLYYNPITKKSKIIYLDIGSLKHKEISIDALSKVSETILSPLKMIIIKKKSYFSLIEIIIAASLFAILLFSTTSLFFRYQKCTAKIATISPEIFSNALFFEKMTEMTMTLDKESITTKNAAYTEFLEFTFDNGFKDQTDLSGECKCKLYRTFDKELIYTITSSNGAELTRPLLSNVAYFTPKIDNRSLCIHIETIHGTVYNYTFLIPEDINGEKA
jgi:hypothetical protein